MLLNSNIFIFFYLPILMMTYFWCNKVHIMAGKMVLIVGNLIFYAYADWHMLFYLLTSIMCNWLFAYLTKYVNWRKLFLIIPIVINVGLLLYFKYTDFIIESFHIFLKKNYLFTELFVPLGISFITFQQIAYLVSVYRKELVKASLVDYLVYILYFPKLLMGPLIEPVDFITQLNDPVTKRISGDHVAQGLKLFSFGLLKKVILADTFATAFLCVWGGVGEYRYSDVYGLLHSNAIIYF